MWVEVFFFRTHIIIEICPLGFTTRESYAVPVDEDMEVKSELSAAVRQLEGAIIYLQAAVKTPKVTNIFAA